MPYCSLADIKTKRIPEQTLIHLTDDDDVGVVNSDVVTETIDEADELIDAYLRSRYTLPLTPVPGLLKRFSATIATYLFYGRRPEFETPERVTDDYKRVLSTLKDVQRGEVQLGSSEPAVEAPGVLAVDTPGAMFDRETLERY